MANEPAAATRQSTTIQRNVRARMRARLTGVKETITN